MIDHGAGEFAEAEPHGPGQGTPSMNVPVVGAVQAPPPRCAAPPPTVNGRIQEIADEAKAAGSNITAGVLKGAVAPAPDPQVAALAKLLNDVGVGLNSYTWDLYQELVTEHGMPAVIAGVTAAADQGKQQSFKYVQACIVNAAKGNNHATDKRAAGAGQATHAGRGGSGQVAGEATGRKPQPYLDPAKIALYNS